MENLFVVKEKTIKYNALVLDIENEDVITYLKYTFNRNFYWLGESYQPDDMLQTINQVFLLSELDGLSQEETINVILKDIEFEGENIGMYSLLTTNTWRDPETLEYVVGVQLKFTEN